VGGLLAIREAAGNGSSKAGQAIFPAKLQETETTKFFLVSRQFADRP
jgi:hypothetical protein